MAPVPAAEVRPVTAVDDALRKDLLACWTDVTNAGGAVGFVPPVTQDDVAPVLDRMLEGIEAGRDVLALLTVDGDTAGFAALVGSSRPPRPPRAPPLRGEGHPPPPGGGPGRGGPTGGPPHPPRPRGGGPLPPPP